MCVCVCVCVHAYVRVYAFRILSIDQMLRFRNTLIVIIIILRPKFRPDYF